MLYIWEHSRLGFCWWDIPALIVLLVVIVVFVLKYRRVRETEKDLEQQVSNLYADEVVNIKDNN